MKLSRKILWLLALLAVMVVVFYAFDSRKAPPVVLPSPNGHDRLVQAGGMLSPQSYIDWKDWPVETLRAYVRTNAAALEIARSGLTQECQVPMTNLATYANTRMTDLIGLKRLAQAFAAEGRLAEFEQRTNDAARSYLAAVRVGHEGFRGGLMIDRLVGVACEAIGQMRLEPLLPALDVATCRELLPEFRAIDAKAETIEEVLRQEQAWVREAESLRQRLMATFDRTTAKARNGFIRRQNIRTQQRRQLMLNLATRVYEADTGHPPKRPEDLVPKYLPTLPSKDPIPPEPGPVIY